METPTVATGPSISASLVALHDESVRYWSSLGTATFLARIGDAWSPAENVRHLTKSMRAMTRGMRLPRLLLLLAFRRSARGSRSYEEVREAYRARLALGASAGRFGPGGRDEGLDPEAERATIMAYHAQAVTGLCAAVRRWPERALDSRRLPHPLLGPLTVREMLLFTLYHNRHHLEGVQRRLALS